MLVGVVVGVVIGSLGSAVVFTLTSGRGTVLHGCRNSRTHIVRFVDTSCTAGETELSWNQTGLQGTAGPGELVSNLAGANFTGASLQYRDLSNVDMRGAVFRDANLTGSSLRGANLSGAKFNNTTLANVDATGANFSGASLADRNSRAADAIFRNVDFTDARLEIDGGDFTGSTFTGANIVMIFSANLHGIDFRRAHVTLASLSGDNLTNANFSGLRLGVKTGRSDVSNANFSNTKFTDGDFTNDVVNGTNFTNAEFTGTSFAGANLSNADLTNVKWSYNVTCPDGTMINTESQSGQTCAGHLVP